MDFKDYYATLGVECNASQEDIKRQYRTLARQYHPDLNQNAEAEVRFKEINEAYEVLGDPDKHAKYDRYGSAWQSVQEEAAPPPGYEDFFAAFDGAPAAEWGYSPFSSFFDFLFGDAQNRRGRTASHNAPWAHRDTDYEAAVSLTLEEAAGGGKRQLSLPDPATGRHKTYAVNFPKGMRPGQRIRLAGQGGQGGDLYLVVQLQPHPRFRLQDKTLHTTLTVTPWVAVLGGAVPLQTLDGAVVVKVPAGSSSGRKIRLKGKGYPHATGTGDLYAEIKIAVPQDLSSRERELFEELATESKFQPALI